MEPKKNATTPIMTPNIGQALGVEMQATPELPDEENNKQKEEKPQKSAKKSHKNAVIIGALAVLSISTIVVATIFAIDSTNKSTEISTLNNKITALQAAIDGEPIDPDTGAIVQSDHTSEVKSLVSDLYVLATQTIGKTVSKVYDESYPFVAFSDIATLAPLEKSYGLSYGDLDDEAVIAEAYSAVKNELSSKGYTNYDRDPESDIYTSFINNETGIICKVDSGIPFRISCGHTSWLSESTAKFAEELARAYFDVKAEYINIINTNMYTIKNSTYSPYQSLSIPVSNAAGLFYRTSPTAKWQFFAATQNILNCNNYTGDVAKAFAGETCWDEVENVESTVSYSN